MNACSYLGRLTEIQSDVSMEILKIIRKQKVKDPISTLKETYVVKPTNQTMPLLSIDDGMDTYSEFSINVSELIGIYEHLEARYGEC